MNDTTPQANGRLDRLESQVHQLADEVIALAATTGTETPTAPARPKRDFAAWVDMDEPQADAALARLREWVGRVLIHHPRTMTRLRPCWFRHPAVVQMLLDVHRAWENAYREGSDDPFHALEWWQRHLPRLDQDMSADLGHCTSVRHDPDQVPLPPADPAEVRVYLAWWGGGRDPGDEPPAP